MPFSHISALLGVMDMYVLVPHTKGLLEAWCQNDWSDFKIYLLPHS